MQAIQLVVSVVNAAILTALIAPLVLWRYRRAVLNGMAVATGAPLTWSAAPAAPAATRAATNDPLAWEARLRPRVFAAALAATLVPSFLLAYVYLYQGGMQRSPAVVLLVAGVTMSAAVPVYSVIMAVPTRRTVWLWLVTMIGLAAAGVVATMVQRLVTARQPTIDQLFNFVVFFQLAAVALPGPALMGLATGARRIRGVAPITFAGLLVFGLAPYLGIAVTQWLTSTRAGSELVLSSAGLETGFVLLSLPVGLLAWARLKRLAGDYEAKRFSEAQLLARTWWLLIVASLGLDMLVVYPGWRAVVLTVFSCVIAYVTFDRGLTRALAIANPSTGRLSRRTLLMLRVFGHTTRTEGLLDRIEARWRLFGPVTMIAGPDIVGRTLDPGDFLRFAAGDIAASFVTSREDLDRRLATLDLDADPDGRYRFDEFCCRDNTWKATVVELIDRADVVLMDLRSFVPGRAGVEFELQQLSARLPHERVVLVVDERSRPAAGAGMVTVLMERNTRAETDALFATLVRAAYGATRYEQRHREHRFDAETSDGRNEEV
jgi:hypothetical protein